VENGRWGLAPSLAFGLGTPTRVTLGYSHLNQDNLPDYGVPWVPADNVPLAAFRDQAPPVPFSNFYGMVDRDYEELQTDLATAQVERDLGRSARVRNVLRYGRTHRDSLVTAPRFQSALSTDVRRTDWKSRDQDDTILADQLTINSGFRAAGVEHALVVGGEFSRETSVNYLRAETAPTLPLTDLYRPHPTDPYTGSLVRTGALTDGEADSLAAFAIDTVKAGSQLELTGALRWDRFRTDYASIDASGVSTPFARTDEMLSWRAGIVYKPRPNGSVYAGAGTSMNPSAEGLALSASTAALEPEKSLSYEVGTKWDVFGNRLALTAALFRTEKSNARTPGINPGDPPTVLQGEHRVEGLDVGLSGRITGRWNVLGGYTYMDSAIVSSNNAAEVGREFGNTPRQSFSLWTSYRTQASVELGGGLRFVGDRFNSNTNVRTAPSYWLIDAMAAYPVNSHLTLRLNATNLGDERYIDRVGGGHFVPGEGRMVALNAAVKF
jgi:catecholate siderophore receptor